MTAPDIYMNARDGYNAIAPHYDGWNWQKIWFALEFPHIRRMIEQDCNELPLKILDIGTGTGRMLEALARDFRLAVTSGTDISEAMLDIARRRLPEDAELELAHAKRLPCESSSFSYVLFCRVGSHIPNLIQSLAEVMRVTLPGGKIFASDIHPDHNYTDTHLHLGEQTVHLETYKHPAEAWLNAARNLGLAMRFSHVVRGREIMDLPDISVPQSVLYPDRPVSTMMIFEKL